MANADAEPSKVPDSSVPPVALDVTSGAVPSAGSDDGVETVTAANNTGVTGQKDDANNENADNMTAEDKTVIQGLVESTEKRSSLNKLKKRTETVTSQSSGQRSPSHSPESVPVTAPALETQVSLTNANVEQQAKNRLRHGREKSLTQPASIDNPPATKWEVWSWYLNDTANSVYLNVGLLLCMPLLLTDLATAFGCEELKYGCDYEGDAINSSNQPRVDFLGWSLRPASYASFVISLSGFFQAIMYIGIGPLADFMQYRKQFLVVSSLAGSFGMMIFIFFWDPSTYWLAGVWLIITNVLYGLSLIFYYAYLPILVEVHWDVLDAVKKQVSVEEMEELYENLSSSISQRGFAAGFLGGLICLIIAAMIVIFSPLNNYEIQNKDYGAVNPDNEFDELYAQYVSSVNVWHYDDDTDYSQIFAIQCQYKNKAVGDIFGTTNPSNISLTQSTYSASKYIKSINLWLDSSTSSITAIQFDSSTIFGNPNVTSISSDASSISSSEGSNYVWAGYSGSLDSVSSVSPSSDVLSSMSFMFRDKDVSQVNNTDGYRLAIFVAGLWWLLFFYFPARYVKNRPGPPFPKDRRKWSFGFSEVYKSLRDAKAYPNLFRYLLAYFLFSDGFNTLATTGVLFASEELGLSNTELVLFVLSLQLFGFCGAFLFLKIETRYKLSNKKMLLMHLACFCCIPVYGLLGFFAPFGLVNSWEIILFGFVYGLNFGSMQSYARSLYAQLIPVGRETEFFSLYQITDKGSSWIGPLFVTIVSNYGSFRWGLTYVLFAFGLSIPIIYFYVSMVEGRIEAGRDLDHMLGRVSMSVQDANHPMFLDMVGVMKNIDALRGENTLRELDEKDIRQNSFKTDGIDKVKSLSTGVMDTGETAENTVNEIETDVEDGNETETEVEDADTTNDAKEKNDDNDGKSLQSMKYVGKAGDNGRIGMVVEDDGVMSEMQDKVGANRRSSNKLKIGESNKNTIPSASVSNHQTSNEASEDEVGDLEHKSTLQVRDEFVRLESASKDTQREQRSP